MLRRRRRCNRCLRQALEVWVSSSSCLLGSHWRGTHVVVVVVVAVVEHHGGGAGHGAVSPMVVVHRLLLHLDTVVVVVVHRHEVVARIGRMNGAG